MRAAMACEKQPFERERLLKALLDSIAEEDSSPEEVWQKIRVAMSKAYSAGFDAGFRLQLNARGKGRSGE